MSPLRTLVRGDQVRRAGEMAEWLKAHAWNACRRATVSWVRIPLSPPSFVAHAPRRSAGATLAPGRLAPEPLRDATCTFDARHICAHVLRALRWVLGSSISARRPKSNQPRRWTGRADEKRLCRDVVL